MDVVVPLGTAEPKTRLTPLLDEPERAAFARAMCRGVIDSLRALDREPTVLADEPIDEPLARGDEVAVTVDERALTAAVDDVLPSNGDEPTAIVMADLALATPEALARLSEATGDVVLAPGRGGGTNAIVARDRAFRVDYHGASIRDHREIARAAGLDVTTIDSFRLATDIDEPADLVEVLLHGEGAARDWLEDAGFELTRTDGRVDVRRNPERI